MSSSQNGKPDALRPAHPLSFFDPEQVERPVPARPWRTIAIAAAIATALLTLGWELYWRANWYEPGDMKNSAGLWAEQRRKATGDATVIIGSSRVLFDINLDIWEEISGVRPVQLALEGTSPRVFLTDLANDKNFKGTLIVGVTVPLFFTGTGGLREGVLQYTKDESLSQRADQRLSMILERGLAFIDESTRPKTMIMVADTPLREGMKPRFTPRKLSAADETRDTHMWARVEEDPEFAQLAKDIWVGMLSLRLPPPDANAKDPPPGFPDEAIAPVIAEVKANVDKIRTRGGDVVFLRLPYTGFWQQVEDGGFPRERVWDRLLRDTDTLGIAWQDYPELQGYHLPEWSHLSRSEAERYTRAVVPIFYKRLDEKQAGSASAE